MRKILCFLDIWCDLRWNGSWTPPPQISEEGEGGSENFWRIPLDMQDSNTAAVCYRLYDAQSTTYSSSIRQHVQLLYMVHCHCEGQMNVCSKYADTATHLILSQGPFLTLGVPMQGWSNQCAITTGKDGMVGGGCVDKGSTHPALGGRASVWSITCNHTPALLCSA